MGMPREWVGLRRRDDQADVIDGDAEAADDDAEKGAGTQRDRELRRARHDRLPDRSAEGRRERDRLADGGLVDLHRPSTQRYRVLGALVCGEVGGGAVGASDDDEAVARLLAETSVVVAGIGCGTAERDREVALSGA